MTKSSGKSASSVSQASKVASKHPIVEDEDDYSGLSPRNAVAIWHVAGKMHAEALLEVASLKSGGTVASSRVLSLLPKICYGSDSVWLERFVQCFADIASRLEIGETCLALCTGDEVALHMIFASIESEIDEHLDGGLDVDEFFSVLTSVENVPEGEFDFDLPYLEDLLLEDCDVLFLYDMSFDGIENSEAASRFGMANLSTDKWFLPFYQD